MIKKLINIKIEVITIILYIIITFLKYALTYNPDFMELLSDVFIDSLIGLIIYFFIKEVRNIIKKELLNK